VVLQLEAAGLGDAALALLDLGVEELLDPAAVEADEVVVVLALVELEHRLAALEVVAREDAGLLELHQHAVHRRQADVGVIGEEDAKDVLGAHVALARVLEDLEHLDARQRRLEAAVLEFFGVGHGRRLNAARAGRVGRMRSIIRA
jgi:hypothetical protein